MQSPKNAGSGTIFGQLVNEMNMRPLMLLTAKNAPAPSAIGATADQ